MPFPDIRSMEGEVKLDVLRPKYWLAAMAISAAAAA
jgi:hypothetical protein